MIGLVILATIEVVAVLLLSSDCTAQETVHRTIAKCHSYDIILHCPPYHKVIRDDHTIDWLAKLPGGTWKKLASLDYGDKFLYKLQNTEAARYQGRLELYNNGSLRISTLHPDDETVYRCEVRADSPIPFKINIVTLNVSCDGKVTESKRELCTEEDILLHCPAKDRTNPRKLSGIKWKRRNHNSSRWSFLVAANGSHQPVYNPLERMRVRLHANGSLLVKGGRKEEMVVYVCEATKRNGVSTPERHQVMIKRLKCAQEKKIPANTSEPLTPCIGRELIVPCPILGHVDPSHIRLLKWRSHSADNLRTSLLVHVRARKSGIQKWHVRMRNGSRSYRVRLGPKGELILGEVTAMDSGAFECVVKTSRHHEAIKHFTEVRPVICPTTKEKINSTNQQNATAPTTKSTPLTTNAPPRVITTTTSSIMGTPTRVPMLKESTTGTTKTYTARVQIPTANGKTTTRDTNSVINNGSHIKTTSTTRKTTVKSAVYTEVKGVGNSTQEVRNVSSGEANRRTRNDSQSATVTSRPGASSKSLPMTSSSEVTSERKTTAHDQKETIVSVKEPAPTWLVKPSAIKITTTTTVSFPDVQSGEGESVTDGERPNGTMACGDILTSLSGEIQSPNFPRGYPGNLDCRWTLRGSEHAQYSAFNIKLVKVSLEQEPECMYDYLSFEDALGNQVGCRHCAMKRSGPSLVIKGRTAVVVFHSDATVSGAGFHLTYTAV